MSLSLGLNPLFLALCLLAAAGLTFWTYRKTVPALSVRRRWLLMCLRGSALFLVLFLLFEPIFRRFHREARPPVLAVLIDDSQSLTLSRETGDGAPETDAGTRDLSPTVRDALNALPVDRLDGEIRYFAFSSDARPLPATGHAIDSLHFAGVRTNIAGGLDYVRDALKDANLGGVLLVSDGQYNTGRNPLYVAERYPVPIYTVAVGDTSSRRDVQIRRVNTNAIAYVGTTMPLRVGLRSEGYPGERVAVSLLSDGQVLGTQTVVLPEGAAEVTVDLTYTPAVEGLHRLSVTVSQLEGEVTHRNNTETVTVRVLERKKRILLLAGSPGPDLSALHQFLSDDPDTELHPYVQKSRQEFYEGTPPPSFDDFDLILLAGYPGREADAAVVQRVARAAEANVPVLFLLGRQTYLPMLQRELADVLPAVPRTIRPGFMEAAFVVSPQGGAHPIFEIPDVSPSLLRRLPPLVVGESRWSPSPDAQVLATTEVRGIPLNEPLLVIRKRGKHRSAALLGAGTWRWKNVPEDLQDVAPFWPSLLSNLIQWVSTHEDDRPVRVEPTEELYGGGEAVQFTGQVYNESLNPVNDAALEVEVIAPDGTRLPYSMETLGNGRYFLDLGALPEGTYRYSATARRNGTEFGTDSGSFAVGTLTLEFKETRTNTTLLRQIAQRSGGMFFLPDQVGRIPEGLKASGSFTALFLNEAEELKLWQQYPFLAAVILLLTLEWFLRKRSGMV